MPPLWAAFPEAPKANGRRCQRNDRQPMCAGHTTAVKSECEPVKTPEPMNPHFSQPSPDIYEQNYHDLIGEEFIRLRGAGFDLSSFDRELLRDWHERGVPLHVPMNVLADAADRIRRMGGPRVRSLSYVKEEVEARFAELVEGHVGCGGCEKSYCAGAGSRETGDGEVAKA